MSSSEIQIRENIREQNLIAVEWYNRDENLRINYQSLYNRCVNNFFSKLFPMRVKKLFQINNSAHISFRINNYAHNLSRI